MTDTTIPETKTQSQLLTIDMNMGKQTHTSSSQSSTPVKDITIPRTTGKSTLLE